MSKIQVAGPILVLSSLCFGSALAAEYPKLSGELVVEIQNDWTYDSEDPAAELNDLSTTTEADLNLLLTPNFFFNTHLTLETVKDPGPNEDRYFEDMGLFVEAISLNYKTKNYHFYAGKFSPNFSFAYDAAPGVFGTDIAEDDIELSERIGVGAAVSFGGSRFGRHTISASAFFADTTAMSESAFSNRGRLREADGGPSNTGRPESFVIALDGEKLRRLAGLRYHLGFARQKVDRVVGETDIADEYRAATGVEWGIDISKDLKVTPLVEYVRFWNAGGLDAENRHYLTAATQFDYGSWNLALAYTGRFIRTGSDVDDSQFQISAGYSFDNGLEAHVGWKIVNEANIQTEVLGVFLAYKIEF